MKKHRLLFSVVAGILVGAALVSLLSGMVASNAEAVTSSELKDQLDALEKEKDSITQRLDELEEQQTANLDDIASILAQKNIIDQQVALRYAEMANLNDQIATYSQMIADKQRELDVLEKRLQELSEQNKERIRAMEEEGGLSLWSVIFEANSFSDLLDRIDMIDEISRSDRKRLEEMSNLAGELEAARDELAEEKKNLEQKREELKQVQAELDAENARADELLLLLVNKAEDLNNLHDEFEQMEEDFLDEIAQTEQAYNDKVAEELESSRKASIQASVEASIEQSIAESIVSSIAESKRQESSRLEASRLEASRVEESRLESSRQEANKKPTTGGEQGTDKNPSGLIWRVPCDYIRVSSAFGYRWHPTTGEYSMHKGVDLAAPKGTPIYATRSGTVTTATYHSTAGNYVTINHYDGYSSVYMHMTHYVVGAGDYVKAGQLIGYVGSTGRSTGPHLHFGISYNGSYVNPMDYIGK